MGTRETEPETEPEAEPHPRSSARSEERSGLLVLWSSEGDEHVGSWLPVPAGNGRLIGRGGARENDELPRLEPHRLRPGSSATCAPFQHPALSRVQLVVERGPRTELLLRNVGRCKLSVNGAETERSTVAAGDVIEVGSQLVLLCTTRPARLSGPPPDRGHEFGHPDAYGFVGESPLAWRLREEIAASGPRRGHVLVRGATGTGKELVARALAALSPGSALTVRNAATIPDSLVDAELFGNLKDYPNPGTPDRPGLLGAAHGGCLFLDEFAELPEKVQAHLLRALDDGEYQRLGEATSRRSRFRLIAATNRPESALRRDLLERFTFRLQVPSLADRREDIPFIAAHLLRRMAEEAPPLALRHDGPGGLPRLTPAFVRKLVRHRFDGNVRELRALLFSSLRQAGDEPWLDWPADPQTTQNGALASTSPEDSAAPRRRANDGEREQIFEALRACGGNQGRAATVLGMSRRTLVRRIEELGVPRPRKIDC